MTTTTHLALTLVESSQAQKEVTVNQALTRIDAILNTGAKSRTTSTPPGSPASGDLYIVGSSPTAAWSGQANQLAYYDQIWRFIAPQEGMTLWVNDEDIVYIYNGSSWVTALANDQTGMVNRFRNGAFDIWQIGTSGTITAGTSSYTADGWIVGCTGANVPWTQVSGRNVTAFALKATGATSVTDILVKQRLRGYLCNALAGKRITVQAKIYNNTGASITPTLTVKRAGSLDSWSSPTTDVNAVSLQACANTTLTTVAYTFDAHASSANGLEFTFDCGNNFSTGGKSVEIMECDVRLTPGIPIGLNASPPAPELRTREVELPLCQRAYCKTFPQGTAPAQGASQAGNISMGQIAASVAAGLASTNWMFPVTMDAVPTVTTYTPLLAGSGGFRDNTGTEVAATVDFIGDAMCTIYNTGTTPAGQRRLDIHATADARL